MNSVSAQAKPEADFLSVLYELLDAHADTLELGGELDADLCWQIHLDYLRALQRKTKEIVARWSAMVELSGPK